MSAIYKRTRPILTIENNGGEKLGNCYYSNSMKITTTSPLSSEKIRALRDNGFLSYGQEFMVHSQCDGKEEPAGYDTVECIDEKTGEPAINQYSGKPYEARKEPYYVYEIENRVDSSD